MSRLKTCGQSSETSTSWKQQAESIAGDTKEVCIVCFVGPETKDGSPRDMQMQLVGGKTGLKISAIPYIEETVKYLKNLEVLDRAKKACAAGLAVNREIPGSNERSSRTPERCSAPSDSPPPKLSLGASQTLKDLMDRACRTPPAYLRRPRKRPSSPTFMEVVRSCQRICDAKIAEIVEREEALLALEPPPDPKYEERRWIVTPLQSPERVSNAGNDESKESDQSDEGELMAPMKRPRICPLSADNGDDNQIENDERNSVIFGRTDGPTPESEDPITENQSCSFQDVLPHEESAEANSVEVHWADEPIDQEVYKEPALETTTEHAAEDNEKLTEPSCANELVHEPEMHDVEEEFIPRRFAILGVSGKERVTLTNTLEALGATVSLLPNFDNSCDAIIAHKITRSEKTLCAIASGKPLLRVTYANACEEHNVLLKVDTYLWTEVDGKSVTEKHMARLAQQWYNKIQEDENNKPFIRLSAWFTQIKVKTRAKYTRLIEAGGGRVAKSVEDANIVIGDGKVARDFKKNKNIPVKLPVYLTDIILRLENAPPARVEWTDNAINQENLATVHEFNKECDTSTDAVPATHSNHLQRRSNTKKSFQCKQCLKQFAHKTTLHTHIREMKQGSSGTCQGLPCKVCGKVMSSVKSLQRHILMHTGVKPFTCKFCKKPFLRHQHLVVHLRIHTGEKPYVCQTCEFVCSDPSSLRRHNRCIHAV